jgi:hypothetical protein
MPERNLRIVKRERAVTVASAKPATGSSALIYTHAPNQSGKLRFCLSVTSAKCWLNH